MQPAASPGFSAAHCDATCAALAHPTRRAILAHLPSGVAAGFDTLERLLPAIAAG
ncbi:MAG: hypothetical protein ABI689_02115 [Thermoanaerobaculia bacterium]